MSQKRVRYQWFREVPRNVTYREFERFQFRSFGAFSLGLTAAVMAIVAIAGLTLRSSQELRQVAALTLEEALAAAGDRPDPIKLEGYLVADDPPTMPDETGRSVIRGRLQISARGSATAGDEEAEAPLREILFEWEDRAERVFLSDGDRRIPLAFDLAILPMQDEVVEDVSPRIVRSGDSARTSRPVAIEYGDQVFPLSPEIWGTSDSVFPDLERQVLPHGQAVVVVANLEATTEGNQLVDTLGDRLHVSLGTEAEILQQGQQLRIVFGLLAIPLGAASFFLGRSAYRMWQDFVTRSNQ